MQIYVVFGSNFGANAHQSHIAEVSSATLVQPNMATNDCIVEYSSILNENSSHLAELIEFTKYSSYVLLVTSMHNRLRIRTPCATHR